MTTPGPMTTDPSREAAPLCLIADNDVGVTSILEAFLVRRGLRVEVVADGRAALERLARGGVDLLVCDLDMPQVSGERLLAELRGDPRCPPVVVVSGYVDEHTRALLSAHPAVRDVLRKPFDVQAFSRAAAALARGESAALEAPSEGLERGLF